MARRPLESANKPLIYQQQSNQTHIQDRSTPLSQCLSLFNFAPAVAALDIGLIAECSDTINSNQNYIMDIDPSTYLVIAGVIGIAWFVWVFTTICCSCICCSTQPRSRYKCIRFCISKITYPMILFYIAWTGIGLYIYEQEIPSTCQQDPIGKMLLSWCVLNLIWIGVLICAVLCAACCK